jgi:hypothetical protein
MSVVKNNLQHSVHKSVHLKIEFVIFLTIYSIVLQLAYSMIYCRYFCLVCKFCKWAISSEYPYIKKSKGAMSDTSQVRSEDQNVYDIRGSGVRQK